MKGNQVEKAKEPGERNNKLIFFHSSRRITELLGHLGFKTLGCGAGTAELVVGSSMKNFSALQNTFSNILQQFIIFKYFIL